MAVLQVKFYVTHKSHFRQYTRFKWKLARLLGYFRQEGLFAHNGKVQQWLVDWACGCWGMRSKLHSVAPQNCPNSSTTQRSTDLIYLFLKQPLEKKKGHRQSYNSTMKSNTGSLNHLDDHQHHQDLQPERVNDWDYDFDTKVVCMQHTECKI